MKFAGLAVGHGDVQFEIVDTFIDEVGQVVQIVKRVRLDG